MCIKMPAGVREDAPEHEAPKNTFSCSRRITAHGRQNATGDGEDAGGAYALKRPLDFVLASLGIVAFLPVALLIVAAIWLEDRGPVFYNQERVGLRGRRFRMYKFRSMQVNAEAGTGAVLAAEDDPRVTRVGRLLRATAMDELPQLLNIWLGDLSVVGPRPERPELVDEIVASTPAFAERHRVRPGLTGLAQVEGRYDTPPERKLELDLEYMTRMSLWLDCSLILRSFWITVRGAWNKRDHR